MNRRHKACRAPRLQPATPPLPLPMPLLLLLLLPPPLTSPPFSTRLRHPAPSPGHPAARPPDQPSTPLLSLPPTSPALFHLPTNPTSNASHHRSVICGLSNSLRGLLLPETLPLPLLFPLSFSLPPSFLSTSVTYSLRFPPSFSFVSHLPVVLLSSLLLHLSISLYEAPGSPVYPQVR